MKANRGGWSRTDSTRLGRENVDDTGAAFLGRPSAQRRTRRTTGFNIASTFDEVAALSVEGVNKSAISRVKGIAWNTVDRWLERAAVACRRFNKNRVEAIEIVELQADEIRTFVGSKANVVWLFAVIEVWSRLWPSFRIGRRSYRNTAALFSDVVLRGCLAGRPLIATDGFEYYFAVVRRLFPITPWRIS